MDTPSDDSSSLRSKVHPLEHLSALTRELRDAGKRIVHCHGVFDLLHIGHVKHLQKAKNHGDILVVTITADRFVNKGPHRPAFTERLRAEALEALECVDFVSIVNSPSAVEAIKAVRPSFYVKGQEYQSRPDEKSFKFKHEQAAVEEFGGTVIFTDGLVFSSTNLINRHLSQFPDHVSAYLADIRQRYDPDYFEALFDRVQNARVLVVGEAIVDDYHYCDVIGKAGKEPVLVGRFKSQERFAGGSVAVAKHMAGFCKSVGVFSTTGYGDATDFLHEAIKDQVIPYFLHSETRPAIVKRRFVERYLLQKLFEVYFMEEDPLSPKEDEELCDKLHAALKDYDVAVVTDYGHGMLSPKAREVLCNSNAFLAVNTQANAGNRGFHTISTYPRADYVSLSLGELRLEFRSPSASADELISRLPLRMRCPYITVTLGKDGIVSFEEARGAAQAPAMTQMAVDRIGSGDAVLALTSPLAWLGIEPEVIAFIGNLAGAEAVGTVGHRSSIDRRNFLRHIASLLK